MSTTTALILAIVLLIGNAYFVASEFALVSARRTKMEPLAAGGSRMARTALRAMEDLSHVIAAAQFGITVCSLGLGAVAEPSVSRLISPLMEDLGVPHGWLHPIGFVIALIAVMYLHVVLGEMVPKNLSLAGPERAAVVLGPPMMALVTVLKPIVVGLDATANAFVRLLRIEPRDELNATYTAAEVGALLDESRSEGLLDDREYERLSGALGFTARLVQEVVMPLDRLESVPRGARVTAVEKLCAETGFSRFPVLDGDELIGYIHIKDVFSADAQGRAQTMEDSWIRPFANVPATDTLGQALNELQSKGAHMALVRGEHGEQLGIATLEDLIEELVGEISDASHTD